jgi:hypothetical protein
MGSIILRPEDGEAVEEVLEAVAKFRRRGPTRGRELVPLASRLGLQPFKKAGGDPKYEREGVRAYVTIPDHRKPLLKRTYHSALNQLEEAATSIWEAVKEAKREKESAPKKGPHV